MRKGDPDRGQGQWRAHHSTGDCSVRCGVDLALVRAARHCLVQGGQTAQTPTTTSPSTARTLRWRWQARRCKGDACAMQGRHTGNARRTPWALPWQPHGSGADLRWKGGREEENNAPVQSDQLLHRTALPASICSFLPLFPLLLLLWLPCPLRFSSAPVSSPSWSRCHNTGTTPREGEETWIAESAAPAAGAGPGCELLASRIDCACRVAALAAEGGP